VSSVSTIPRADLLLLDASEELALLLVGLEASMSDLGGGIDELEGDLFQSGTLGLNEKGLAERDATLLGSHDATLDHEPVLVDLTVVRESSERSNGLLGQIVGGGSVVGLFLLSDLVDLLVDLGTMVVTVLTSARDLELDASRMPSTDTSDLAETTMGLTRETSHTPTSDDTVNSATLGNTDHIDHLVLSENVTNTNLLLKQVLAEVDLGIDGSTVDLNFLHVSLLLAELALVDLGVDQQTHNGAVLLRASDVSIHLVRLELLSVLGESFLLGLVPVLVESSLESLPQVTCEDGGQSTKSTWSLDVSDESNRNHWWSLQDGDWLDHILLVELGTRLGDGSDNVGHTSLETHKSGQVARLGSIILRERFDLSVVVFRALLGKETQVSVTRALELTMGHSVAGNTELHN